MIRLVRFTFFLLLIMALGAVVSFADTSSIRLKLDGGYIVSDSPPVIVDGRTLVPVRAISEAMGYTVSWEAATREVAVSSEDTDVRLAIGSGIAYINGEESALDVPAQIINDRTMVPVRFISETMGSEVSWDDKSRVVVIVTADAAEENDPALPGSTEPSGKEGQAILDQYGLVPVATEARRKLIVIDPGHGGTDTGARGYEYGVAVLNEKDVNLDVALRVQKMLDAAGARIYMIRTEDVTIPLYDRQDTANRLGASLYVAIHNNSYPSGTPSGTEVHYHGKYDTPLDGISSMAVAEDLQRTLTQNLGLPDRGTKVSPELAVLRRTVMPAVIIEGAFMSSQNDLNYMKTDDFREKYAMSVAKSIISALNNSISPTKP